MYTQRRNMVYTLRFALTFLPILLSFALVGQDSSTPICDCLARLEQELDSKKIKDHPCLQRIIGQVKDPVLLIDDLDNVDSSLVYSHCKSRPLTFGEVALIIMERIEHIPYATALGIQNCTHAHCEDNSNLIEYFFSYWDDYTYDYLFDEYRNYLQSVRRQEFIEYWKNRDR